MDEHAEFDVPQVVPLLEHEVQVSQEWLSSIACPRCRKLRPGQRRGRILHHLVVAARRRSPTSCWSLPASLRAQAPAAARALHTPAASRPPINQDCAHANSLSLSVNRDRVNSPGVPGPRSGPRLNLQRDRDGPVQGVEVGGARPAVLPPVRWQSNSCRHSRQNGHCVNVYLHQAAAWGVDLRDHR